MHIKSFLRSPYGRRHDSWSDPLYSFAAKLSMITSRGVEQQDGLAKRASSDVAVYLSALNASVTTFLHTETWIVGLTNLTGCNGGASTDGCGAFTYMALFQAARDGSSTDGVQCTAYRQLNGTDPVPGGQFNNSAPATLSAQGDTVGSILCLATATTSS